MPSLMATQINNKIRRSVLSHNNSNPFACRTSPNHGQRLIGCPVSRHSLERSNCTRTIPKMTSITRRNKTFAPNDYPAKPQTFKQLGFIQRISCREIFSDAYPFCPPEHN
jgi:hypothetical protein